MLVRQKMCNFTFMLPCIVIIFFNNQPEIRGQVQSDMDFGPVVKPLGITAKKEAGKVVETSDVVRPQATREFRKEGQEPRSPK